MIDFETINLTQKDKSILTALDHIIETGETTAVETANATGLSTATVSRVLSELRHMKLIVLSGRETSGMGRPTERFRLNASFGYLLFFKVGASFLECSLADFEGTEIMCCSSDISRNITVEEFCALLKIMAEKMTEDNEIKTDDILLAGISLPGMVDSKNNVIRHIPNFVNFNNTDLVSAASAALGKPVEITNSARLSAVGELIQHYSGCDNLIYLDFTRYSGIGAGIISNGKLLSGRNGLAGEIGDMLVDPHGFYRNYADDEGCLEAMAGVGVMYDRLSGCINSGRARILREIIAMEGSGGMTLRNVEEAVLMQDLDVSDIFDETIKMWAVAVVNLITVLDPDILILGGVIDKSNDVVLARMNHYITKILGYDIDIRPADAGDEPDRAGGLFFLKKHAINNVVRAMLSAQQ